MDYGFVSEVDGGRAVLYQAAVDSNTVHVLVRVKYTSNDNAFSPNADGYTQGVDWNRGHRLSDLIRTDAIEMFMVCGSDRWEWRQDLIHNFAGLGEFDWRSDTMGDDGAPVSGSSNGIIVTSHSSLEYNLENSSWMINQASLDPYDWTSPDVNGDNTISTVDPDDISSITGLHEDYPFFASTGALLTDLYEWAINYEMTLDVSHCSSGEAVIGVASIHNSPEKGPDADGDGVADSADLCPETDLPESSIPTVELRGKRYADITGDGVFESGNSRTDQLYSVVDTGGCSAEQIIAQWQLGLGHSKYGLANSVLNAWIALVNEE
jgi:hypothetical protein